jgi:hypothetical protein
MTRRAHAAPPPPRGHASEVSLNPPEDVRIVRDDTDFGGPLVVQSDDPDLNPPRTPKDTNTEVCLLLPLGFS